MQLTGAPAKAAIALVVLAVIGLGYLLWSRSVPPEPTIPAGQSLTNPLGESPRNRTTSGGGTATGGPGGNGSTVNVPTPGSVDPRLGMGPSQGARGRMPGTR